MRISKTTWFLVLCLVTAACGPVSAEGIGINILATAQELSGQTFDRFTLGFTSNYDIRLVAAWYDMTTGHGQPGGPLFFDVAGAGSYDFTVQPESSPVGTNVLVRTDGGSTLKLGFNDFQSGETLVFGIDVDGPDCSTFTPAQFDNTLLLLKFDPSPAFPGADMFWIGLYFQGDTIDAGTSVPEPATCALLAGGVALAAALRRKRRSR